MTFRLTPARRELLAAVGRGEVREHYPIGLAPFYSRREGDRRVVSAAMEALRKAGLVDWGPKPAHYKAPRPWVLTAAGAALLSEDES